MKPKHHKPNRLIDEKSPYLLQHAYNPVDWYPWNDEAFAKAKRENKPIFLSIGYSSCHWCHVMEEESFADEQVAEVLNQDFVPIKVDREERPDIDHFYMMVCQAMTGQGGWPLTILLTPEQKPFFAGTYLPKEDRYGRTGLLALLKRVTIMWNEESHRAIDLGEEVTDRVQTFLQISQQGEISKKVLDQAYQEFVEQYDEIFGGFGEAPKFPRPHDLLFLLRYARANPKSKAKEMVERTLRMMRRGGIFDQIGFGFARYSVDRHWLVPHFEKMLYDQAMLALAYTEAYQLTQDPYFRHVVEEIFVYVQRELTDPKGGFYSAEDADSEGIEGKFYVWTPQEVKEVLGEEDGALFCKAFDIRESSNFEEYGSIPNLLRSRTSEMAKQGQISQQELADRLEKSREKLFKCREKRVHPHKDDKILTSWNGLMIAAFAYAGRAFQLPEYIDVAKRAAQFIHTRLTQSDGRLWVRYRDGDAKVNGFIDDYAFMNWGFIELYQATLDEEYLNWAFELTIKMKELFWDEHDGGFFFSGSDGELLLTRHKEHYDGAIPSGNAVAGYNLLRLASLTRDQSIEKMADQQLKAFARAIQDSLTSHSFFLLAIQFAFANRMEIVIDGEKDHSDVQEATAILQQAYLPEAVILFREQSSRESLIPSLGQLPTRKSQQTLAVYICENYACQQPITSLNELKSLISQGRS
ncbi:hypothetical protein SAMN05444392_101698 [Seinonella peptonophila]|uniref:Spermatogenesis-associated protein 20-like TRX domain-containing protein n=1 Tax=Seinonella peptonophila TaxID=112248 RepID=A0A1M4TXQ3_9BACL|nr:thioredoxin domain-containing protein [Seinonella peptonophila]SHE49212.1 hypothetical protein SAMN05444392_101698 [Seinonella peptonophila]